MERSYCSVNQMRQKSGEFEQPADLAVERANSVRLWSAWTISCGAGEFVGMAAAAGIASLLVTLFGEPRSLPARLGCVVAMVFAGVLEGAAIGLFQWRVLRRVFPAISAQAWLTPTVIVAALGWFVGMLPQALLGNGNGNGTIAEPPLETMMIIVAIFGAVAGAAFGFAQWLVLHRHVERATIWIWANVCGWAPAMTVIYFGATLPSDQWPTWAVVATGATTGILAGLVIGAVTGVGLLRLMSRRTTKNGTPFASL